LSGRSEIILHRLSETIGGVFVYRIHFGPSWPEVVGFGSAGPDKQLYGFDRNGTTKKYANVATVALLAVFTSSCLVPILPFNDIILLIYNTVSIMIK
jgi:hypothetical protein